MMQLTAEAAAEIQDLRPQYLPQHRMARIACPGGRLDAARLMFVATARPGDDVIESHGVAMCVDHALADRLNAMVLDVRAEPAPRFYVRAQERANLPADA